MPKPLTITTPGDRDIVVVRQFDAPRDLVFLCYSRPDLMRRWYGIPDWTTFVCDIDFRVGGKFRIGQRSPEGYELASQGVYTAIVAPERIEQTEYYDDDWTKGGSTNVLVLTEQDGITTSTMTITYSSPEARAAAAATPMAEGMEIGFKRLDAVLAEEQRD
jgi:uncharacterized protein YndB with AHSA1/START domain